MITKFSNILLSFIACYVIMYISLYSTAFYGIKFYKHEFNKYNIYKKFPNHNIDEINENVISYLKDNSQTLLKGFFNTREIEHLRDVKELFTFFKNIFKICILIVLIIFILILCYTKSFDTLLNTILSALFYGALLSLSLIILLGISIFCDFDTIFTKMHDIFFKPNSWIFDFDDNIVNLYVEDFFYDISISLIRSIIIKSILWAVLSRMALSLIKNRITI